MGVSDSPRPFSLDNNRCILAENEGAACRVVTEMGRIGHARFFSYTSRVCTIWARSVERQSDVSAWWRGASFVVQLRTRFLRLCAVVYFFVGAVGGTSL